MNMQSLYIRLFLYLFLLIPSVFYGQGSRYESHPAMKTRPDGALIPVTASIAVCTQPANTGVTPCSPLATLYTDATLSTPCTGTNKDGSQPGASNCSNPISTDAKGNYHFYAATNVPYTLQVSGSGIVTSAETDIVVPCGPANCTLGSGTFSGAVTAGTGTFSGPSPWYDVSGQAGATVTNKMDAVVTAAGSNAAVGFVPSTVGTGCPTTVPANVMFLDFRGTSLANPCGANFLTFHGTTVPGGGTVNALLRVDKTVSGSTASEELITGVANHTGNLSPSVAGGSMSGITSVSKTSGAITVGANFANLVGFESIAQVSSTGGTIPEVDGLSTAAEVTGGTTAVTNLVSARVQGIANGGGTVTNAYGLKADTQTAGSTRNYSIWSLGNMLVGTNGGGWQLDVEKSGGTIGSALLSVDGSNNAFINGIGGFIRMSVTSGGTRFFETSGSSSMTFDPSATGIAFPFGVAGSAPRIIGGASGFIESPFFRDDAGTSASSGLYRLTNTDKIAWRNAANTGDDAIGEIQTKRGVSGCSTTGGASPWTGSCTTVITWPSAFADSNYTATCVGNGVGAGVPILQIISSKGTSSITVTTQQATGTNASFTTIECTAVHD